MALKCKLTHNECQMSTWYLFICNVEDSMSDTKKKPHKQTNKQSKAKNRKQKNSAKYERKKHIHIHFWFEMPLFKTTGCNYEPTYIKKFLFSTWF